MTNCIINEANNTLWTNNNNAVCQSVHQASEEAKPTETSKSASFEIQDSKVDLYACNDQHINSLDPGPYSTNAPLAALLMRRPL